MSDFVPVAKTTEFSDPSTLLVEVEDRLVMLACVGGQYYALDDVCTHDGGPLSEGALGDDCTIACPRHGAKFDLKTGAAVTMPATQATAAHDIKIEGDTVFVRIGCADSSTKQDECCSDQVSAHQITGASGSTASPASPESTREVAASGASETAGTSAAADSVNAQAEEQDTGGEISESRVLESLKSVIDPELFVNIVDLGLIYTVDLQPIEEVEDKFNVSVEMTMTSPACPAGPQLLAQSKDAVSRMDKVEGVEIKLVMEPAWTPDRMTEDAKDQLGIF